jgi:hypothetical protein
MKSPEKENASLGDDQTRRDSKAVSAKDKYAALLSAKAIGAVDVNLSQGV